MASIIEWQFARFDTSFPILTLSVLILLLLSPILLILLFRINKARKKPETKTVAEGIRRSKLIRKFLWAISGGLLLAAAVTALMGWTTGGAQEKPVTVTVGELEQGADVEGMVRIKGNLQLDRIGFFEDRLLMFGRTLWVAPATSAKSDGEIALFVEIDQDRSGPAEATELTGFLRQAGVPGELRTLYGYAGYNVRQPTYLLFRSADSAKAPIYGAAVDFLLLALIFSLFGLVQTVRIKGLERKG